MSVFKIKKQRAEFEIYKCGPGDKCKKSKPFLIFTHIFGIGIALSDKIGHCRSGKPSNEVHTPTKKRIDRIEKARNVIRQHSDNDNVFYLISV